MDKNLPGRPGEPVPETKFGYSFNMFSANVCIILIYFLLQTIFQMNLQISRILTNKLVLNFVQIIKAVSF